MAPLLQPDTFMAIVFTTQSLAGGFEYLKVEASGPIDVAEAQQWRANLESHHRRLPVLIVTDASTELSAEARLALGELSSGSASLPCAVVTLGAPPRSTLGHVLKASGPPESTRVFSTQSKALAWLRCMTESSSIWA